MTDHEAELEKLCDRLEAHMGQANMQDVLRDANEAARLLREMAAENERLKGAISWLDAEFVDETTPRDELFKRVCFMRQDRDRATCQALTKGKPHD